MQALSFLIFVSVFGNVLSLSCYSSNGRSRDEDDTGVKYECNEAANAEERYCIKFNTDTRPGKVIRDCDHIYEQLFGYDTFAITGEGCRRFEAKIGDMSETGILCACKTDNCNGEPILDSDVTLP